MEQKTILFITSRLPFPKTSGRKTSLFHYCRILSEELNCRLVVLSFLEANEKVSDTPSFIHRLEVLSQPSSKGKIKNILVHSFIRGDWPLQVALYWSPKAKDTIDRVVAEEKPDIVMADMVRCAEYIRNIPVYRVADLDDRLSLRYKRQLRTGIENINPYGNYINLLPRFARNVGMCKPVKSMVVRREIKLLKKYELDIGNSCDKTIFVAEEEAAAFNGELGEEKAIAIPIGVETAFFLEKNPVLKDKTIGFLGSLVAAHNENAVRYFVEKIFPKILSRHNDAKFLVIGGGASDELLKFGCKNIEFTGEVADVREYMEQCGVMVCPLLFGSGIKTKNLEAMALGIPVVTTSIGAENIGAQNGRDWLIADDPETIANLVSSLLADPMQRLRIGDNGRRFVAENWSWDSAKERFETLLVGISR